MTKIYIKTFGCQMNEYDSSRMLDLLVQTHKVTVVLTPEEAEILILNTCAIREKAQEKVFSELGRWRKLKQHRVNLLIGVVGCVASQAGETIIKRAPFVDFVLGPQTIHKLPEVIDNIWQNSNKVVDVEFLANEKFSYFPTPTVYGPSAYLVIMEGCNKYCSYCIVPYTRGREISRPVADILAEATALLSQGVTEITLLGQNVNAYRGLATDGTIVDFPSLITKLAAMPAIKRLRFMTSHPVEFSSQLIEVFANTTKLVDHLHLPVQSGSDRILKLMQRRHTIAEYKAKINALRKIRPNMSISSDFIVGFPGETEADFAATLELVTTMQLDQSFSFIYSKRPGTKAADYPDEVSLATKKARLAKLQALIQEQTKKRSMQMLGGTQAVLVAGQKQSATNLWFGKTANNRMVYFSGKEMSIGAIVKVHISKVMANTLHGELLG